MSLKYAVFFLTASLIKSFQLQNQSFKTLSDSNSLKIFKCRSVEKKTTKLFGIGKVKLNVPDKK